MSETPQEGGRAPDPAAVFWMGLETAQLSSSTSCQHIPKIPHPSKETVRSPKACKNTLEFIAKLDAVGSLTNGAIQRKLMSSLISILNFQYSFWLV